MFSRANRVGNGVGRLNQQDVDCPKVYFFTCCSFHFLLGLLNLQGVILIPGKRQFDATVEGMVSADVDSKPPLAMRIISTDRQQMREPLGRKTDLGSQNSPWWPK